MTSNLERRIAEHRAGHYSNAFTERCAIDRLIYAESYATAWEATQRERQLKAWRRAEQVALINAVNPSWRDLAAGGA